MGYDKDYCEICGNRLKDHNRMCSECVELSRQLVAKKQSDDRVWPARAQVLRMLGE